VNSVAPGRINSPQILDKLHPTVDFRRDFIQRNIPAGSFGEPKKAACRAFLACAAGTASAPISAPRLSILLVASQEDYVIMRQHCVLTQDIFIVLWSVEFRL
jgi:NAD(P)-dependent dehydrogenase (short-subunit alcohol dehydrogenase family)